MHVLDEIVGDTRAPQEDLRNLSLGAINGVNTNDRRPPMVNALQPPNLAQVNIRENCSVQNGPTKLCPCQICHLEVCPAEVCPAEARPAEVRQAEVRSVEVRPGEIRLAKIHHPKVCQLEIHTS